MNAKGKRRPPRTGRQGEKRCFERAHGAGRGVCGAPRPNAVSGRIIPG